jgi:hypothetical protein
VCLYKLLGRLAALLNQLLLLLPQSLILLLYLLQLLHVPLLVSLYTVFDLLLDLFLGLTQQLVLLQPPLIGRE